MHHLCVDRALAEIASYGNSLTIILLRRTQAVGLVDEAWLSRPRGSVAHALQSAAVGLRARLLPPHGCVFMASGGAPISWEVQVGSLDEG